MTGQTLLLRGDARRLPLADASVDLIVTSPPYWQLRAYTDAGERYAGQLGGETDWRDYLAALVQATAEMVRVLKPSGSIFVNLGDKYVSPGGHTDTGATSRLEGRRNLRDQGRPPRGDQHAGVRAKSLLLLPERYRIACIDELGLIARAVIVWHKPNALPESMNDRVKRAHEDWVHLTTGPRYYSAVDELREPHANPTKNYGPNGAGATAFHARDACIPKGARAYDGPDPLGKLPGSVWSIPTEQLRAPKHLGIDHYAAFPTEWPRRLILGWSPHAICLECDQGRFPVVDRTPMQWRESPTITGRRRHDDSYRPASGTMLTPATARILGYACACTPYTDHPERRRPTVTPGPALSRDRDAVKAARDTLGQPRAHADSWPQRQPVRDYHLEGWTPPPTRPSVVLDPFAGSGTVPMVARVLGRVGVGVDLSVDYLRLARWRIHDSGHAARALARTNHERQTSLDLEGAAG